MLLCMFAVSAVLRKSMWFTWFIWSFAFRRRGQYDVADVAKSLEGIVCSQITTAPKMGLLLFWLKQFVGSG